MPPGPLARGAPAAPATQFRLSALCRGPALFLQPRHGASLACGGAAALIAQAGWSSTIVTAFGDAADGVCAGGPPARLASSCDADAVLTLRRAEEACAAAVLGCDIRGLGRQEAPAPADAISAQAPPAYSSDLARCIALDLLGSPGWREGTQVFVPVAAGQSPGHRVLFQAGRTLASCGVRVWAYEDVASELAVPGATDIWVADGAGALGEPLLLAIDTVLPRKLDAVACQPGELSTVCPSVRDLRAALAARAWQLGRRAGQACEQYWPVLA